MKPSIIEQLERIENTAHEILQLTAALKEELSGGSDSSFSKPVLSLSQKNLIISNRMKTALKSSDVSEGSRLTPKLSKRKLDEMEFERLLASGKRPKKPEHLKKKR